MPISPAMQRNRYRNRLSSRAFDCACRRGLPALMGLLCVVVASAHEPLPPPHAGRDLPRGSWSGDIGPDVPYYPEIGIEVRPELEHWPGNYRPDAYRLPGYDGQPAGHHVCRGAHGSTLSSAGTDCPRGEKPEKGGRHLSTDGS